jgi:hypothetical protein
VEAPAGAERLWSELLIGAAPLISGHSQACPNPRKQSIGMGLALFSRRANMLVPQRSQRFPKSSAGDALPSDSSFLTPVGNALQQSSYLFWGPVQRALRPFAGTFTLLAQFTPG